MARKAMLFDLDGTLLPTDIDEFIKIYLKEVGKFVGPHFPAEEVLRHLLHGTKAMIENYEAEKTNAQVFEEAFLAVSGWEKERIWPLFDRFYEEVFPRLSVHVQPSLLARKILQEAVDQGYDLVIATNPLFPAQAIRERMRWAGVDDFSYRWVTVYEEAHFCKPHLTYYREICDRLDLPPENCLMIGNDMQEDMVAGQLGMRTYWVTDFAIDRGDPIYPVSAQGTLKELLAALKKGEGIFA